YLARLPVNGKRLGALLLFLACPESGSVIAAAYSGITARASAVLNGG
ncbi:TPA: hypothetical protein LUK53_005028, partial [Escherichia coli]|nr:hypothetical protein [Escherichia coli]